MKKQPHQENTAAARSEERVRFLLPCWEKVLTKGCNRREVFIADSGTTIPIVPKLIAVRNKVKIFEVDQDEPGVISASGHDMTIIGQAVFWIKFDIMRNPKRMRVLICEEEGDEILIDVQSLVDWSILPPNFPEPMDPKERVRLTKSVPTTKLVETKEAVGSQSDFRDQRMSK